MAALEAAHSDVLVRLQGLQAQLTETESQLQTLQQVIQYLPTNKVHALHTCYMIIMCDSCARAQEVSSQLIAKVWVPSQGSPCGFVVNKMTLGQVYL